MNATGIPKFKTVCNKELIMKPIFNFPLGGMTGHFKNEKIGYRYYKMNGVTIMVKKPVIKIKQKHLTFANQLRNMHVMFLHTSAAYQADLKTYSALLLSTDSYRSKAILTARNVFIKMMWALQKRYPAIILEKLTVEEIIANGYPVVTVANAMENGILQYLPTATNLQNKM
jgi:hypothetical protein